MAYLRDPNNLIPIMTSNSAPLGIASASTEYGTASYAAFNAFNGVSSSSAGFLTANGTTYGWLEYQFARKVVVNSYRLYSFLTEPLRAPKDWTFEAWAGSKWIVLQTIKNCTGWADDVGREFMFSNSKAYLRYRINCTANNGNVTCLAIGELEMMYEKYRDGNRFNRSSLLTLPVAKGGGF